MGLLPGSPEAPSPEVSVQPDATAVEESAAEKPREAKDEPPAEAAKESEVVEAAPPPGQNAVEAPPVTTSPALSAASFAELEEKIKQRNERFKKENETLRKEN